MLLVIIINLIMFFVELSSLTKIILPQRHEATISEKTLNKFRDYDFIYHFTNSTQEDFTVCKNQTALLVNYDYKITIKVPPAVRYFHLIFLEDIKKLILFRNFNSFDIVLFVIYKNYGQVLMDHVRFGGGIFIYYKLSGNLYTTCYYCGEDTKEMQFVSDSISDVPLFTKYINSFTDFNGHTFEIGYANYAPFFEWNNHQETGMEAEILKVISKQLNFNYRLIPFNETKAGSPWENLITGVRAIKRS